MRKLFLPLLLVAGAAAAALAGPKLDAVHNTTSIRRLDLDDAVLTLADDKARRAASKAAASLDLALDLFEAGDERSVGAAFKALGKGMKGLEKLAARAGSPAFAEFVADTDEELWLVCQDVFLLVSPQKSGDSYELLGKKLRSPLKLAQAGKYGQAVSKLAGAWRALVTIDPDP